VFSKEAASLREGTARPTGKWCVRYYLNLSTLREILRVEWH